MKIETLYLKINLPARRVLLRLVPGKQQRKVQLLVDLLKAQLQSMYILNVRDLTILAVELTFQSCQILTWEILFG